MTDTLVWDEAGARYYETGVSKGILWTPKLINHGGVGVPWNGLVAVNIEPQGGEVEAFWFDGVKYMTRILAEDFQATIQAISTPKEFRACEGDREFAPGVMTSFNVRDKFHMAWRTIIGSDTGEETAYKWHIAYNNIVQPSGRSYQTISDSTAMDTRSFTVTATPACNRQSYFWFDSRDYDLSALEAQLLTGVLPMCYELADLVVPYDDSPPLDPDYGCPKYIEDFEEYINGQLVDETKTPVGTDFEVLIHGALNSGLDITELPAEGAFAANDSAASEVGTGSLVDDDDTTYITSADGDLGWTVGLPPLVGYVDGATFELHIRASISGGVNPDDPDNIDADMQVHISSDADGDLTIGGFSDGTDEGMGFALSPVDGTIVDYVVPLYMDAWVDSTIDDVVAALNDGAYLNIVGATNNNPDPTDTPIEVNVYEASVVMLNDTEPSKSLRPDVPGEDGYSFTKINLYDGGTDYMNAAHTAYSDFKITEIVYDAALEGFRASPLVWEGSVTPGETRVEVIDGVLNFNWYYDGAVIENVDIDPDQWYTVQGDWNSDEVRIRLYRQGDPTNPIFDHTRTTTEVPRVSIQIYGSWIADATKAFEYWIDNVWVQVHCNVEAGL